MTAEHDTLMRWGIASTGGIATRMATELAALPNAEIVAVGSRDRAGAEAFAERFGIASAHGSHAELCADPDVEIIYVASPHSAHRDMTIAALEAGKHVLCEKAFAVNAQQAREMIGAARRSAATPLAPPSGSQSSKRGVRPMCRIRPIALSGIRVKLEMQAPSTWAFGSRLRSSSIARARATNQWPARME